MKKNLATEVDKILPAQNQLSLFPNSGIQSQSVSNGALSQGSETEQQRQRQFNARMEEFEKSYLEWPEVEQVFPRKRNRTTQQSKPNHYGTSKKIA